LLNRAYNLSILPLGYEFFHIFLMQLEKIDFKAFTVKTNSVYLMH